MTIKRSSHEENPSSARRHPKQARLRSHVPRRATLPWIRCRHCHTRLVQMDVVDGRACVWVGRVPKDHEYLRCPHCGLEREFRGGKM